MALVTNITNTVQIPGENESVVIRKLSHKELKEAARARQSEGVGFMRELGGELMKALRDEDNDKIKRIQEQQEANVSNYDRDTLLRRGVVSWTYSVPPIAPTPLADAKTTRDGIDELDEPTAKFLAQAIFDFSRPDSKEEAKNVSGASTSS